VPQEPGPRVVLRQARRHTLQSLPSNPIACLLELGDYRGQRRACGISRNLLPIFVELLGGEVISTGGNRQAARIEGQVSAMASHAGDARDVCLVRGLVFGEANVAIRTEHLAGANLVLEGGQQGDHRRLHRLLVGLAVGLEITLGVVQLEPDEVALKLLRPTTEG
jgi:hypothetical protein